MLLFLPLRTTVTAGIRYRLVKTAEKLVKEAQLSERSRDEEKAYLLYMRYFKVVKVSDTTALGTL